MHLAFELMITAICLGMLATGVLNLLRVRRDYQLMRARALPLPAPLISVCIPARNEARNLGRCLDSLARQRYPNYEVLVLDDCSTDETAAVAERHCAGRPNMRVLRGKPLEPGWIGKPHACRQLAEAARGEYLLFTDADTWFSPRALERGLRLALARRADLLSGMVRMENVTLWERLSVPMLALIGAGAANFHLMTELRWDFYGGASGAFLFFRRAAYDAIGGHACVQSRIVEDVEIARAVKRAGLRLVMSDVTRMVSVRMYTSFREVWEGFTKNVYAAFPGLLSPLAIVFLYVIFTGPWVNFILALGRGTWEATILPLTQIASIALLKAGVELRMGTFRFSDLLLTPLAGLMMAAIAARSASRALLRQPTPWRAREYELWKS